MWLGLEILTWYGNGLVAIFPYWVCVQQRVRVEEKASQYETEDTHPTEKQSQEEAASPLQNPSPPQRTASFPLVENRLGYTFAGTTSTAQHPICTKAEEEVCKFCAAPPIPLSEDSLTWWRENELMHLNSCSYTRTRIFHQHPPVINYKLSTFTLTFVYYVVLPWRTAMISLALLDSYLMCLLPSGFV